MDIPKRTLGKTGLDITILGLGGEGILRTYENDKEAYELINKAVDNGITYLESARAYSGSESYYGKALKERRKDVFLASKSHARDKKGALIHLHETLKNMRTDHLDLWQVHDVRTDVDIEEIFGKDGAIEAFADAKTKGLTRFIGVTGHQNPKIIRQCIERFDFDTVLIPANPAEPVYQSFLEGVVPLANTKGIGIIGMKVYFRGLALKLSEITLESLFRFALSQPITTAVIGCDNTQQLDENVRFATSLKPMTDKEIQGIVAAVSPYAGRLMYYKA